MKLFEELIGNERLKATVGADILTGAGSHAYILDGPKGSGKHTASKLIASAILCKRESDIRFPCGKCISCRKVRDGISPDVITIDRGTAATIGIDTVRNLKASLYYAPVEEESKIYIIEDADKMTVQAQNSLLLSLEEPPSFVNFILLCTDSKLLLETVRSRAPVIKTELFTPAAIVEYLSHKEEYAQYVKSGEADRAASSSGGSIGKAISLLTDPDSPDFKEASLVKQVVPVLVRGTPSEKTSLLKLLPTKRDEAVSFMKTLEIALRDILSVKIGKTGTMLFYTSPDEPASIASKATVKRLAALCTAATDSAAKISANINAQPVEALLLTLN
ncbi:MAG: hypothetical protein IJS45_01430 [Clostridia bacterium]|nr:hypothetical protein [Clostridia bacterium]